MKTIIVVIISLFATNFAQASWYQEYCSDAERKASYQEGHNENFFRFVTEDGGYSFDPYDLVMEELRVIQIRKSSGGTRQDAWYEEVNYKKIQVSQKDGSVFPEGISGRSKDGKSVTVDFLCHKRATN